MNAGRGPNKGISQLYNKLLIYSMLGGVQSCGRGMSCQESGASQSGVVQINQSVRSKYISDNNFN
jgi:hypothetical protein